MNIFLHGINVDGNTICLYEVAPCHFIHNINVDGINLYNKH
jgi:hypothetical protein